MNESVIIDAVRSPIGLKNGKLVGIRPDDLTAQVVKGLLSRNENLIQIAKNLYTLLRQVKNKGYKTIAVEKIPNFGMGKTINDRLKRASKY